MWRWLGARCSLCCAAAFVGCAAPAECGPTEAVVARVVDGDTIELVGGQKVRYLLVDTPEVGENECHSQQSLAANRRLVEHRRVQLRYEPACTDRFGRLLAYVSVDEREVNALLVEQGHACVLHVPPSGDERVGAFRVLERRAQNLQLGLWGACALPPCG
jgi:micrococcal nuclease